MSPPLLRLECIEDTQRYSSGSVNLGGCILRGGHGERTALPLITRLDWSEPELDLSCKSMWSHVEMDHSLCTRTKETEATYLLRKSLESRRSC
jgi:hypothetical protein